MMFKTLAQKSQSVQQVAGVFYQNQVFQNCPGNSFSTKRPIPHKTYRKKSPPKSIFLEKCRESQKREVNSIGGKSFEPRNKPSYFPLYWSFNKDPCNGLL